jgi:hypothetical protein
VNATAEKPLVGEPVVLAEEILTDPLTVFTERAEAMARARQAGEILLCDAVDKIQQVAEGFGLVIELGQDAVQAMMAEIFAPVRRAGATPTAAIADDQYEGLSSTFAAVCRVADGKQAPKADRPAHRPTARALVDDDVSLERTWQELNARAPDAFAEAEEVAS